MTPFAHEHSRRRQTINPQGADTSRQRRSSAAASPAEADTLSATMNGSASVRALVQTRRSLGDSPRVAQLTQLSALAQKRAGRPANLADVDERPLQLMSDDAHVVQREEWDDDTDDDDDDLSDLEQEYLPPAGATLWDFIEPVLTPAVKKAEERALALKEEADRLEAEAKALRDAEAEAQAREQQRIAAEELERARIAAELQAQAEALAKQHAEAESQKKAAEALKLTKPTPKSKLGPNRTNSSSNVVAPLAPKKKNRGTPMMLGVANVGGLLGRQTITTHPTFVLNLFYSLSNHPGYNQIHVHLNAAGVVVYVSMKSTVQQGNGTNVPNNSALFAEAAQRAAHDK